MGPGLGVRLDTGAEAGLGAGPVSGVALEGGQGSEGKVTGQGAQRVGWARVRSVAMGGAGTVVP